MRFGRRALCAACLVALSGCAPKLIPGTNIQDSPDTHAILSVLEKYRTAVENRDTDTLLSLVSTDFHDNAGSTNPEDAMDYATLQTRLPQRLARVDEVTLELSIRGVQVDKDVANAVYYYSEHYRLPKLGNKPHNDGGLKQMWFKRVGKQWKITSGI